MIKIHSLGLEAYETTFEKMKAFTMNRNESTADELWLVEHPPVYTQGQAGKKEHILNQNNIPIIQSDRGGQVTYHGPGQLVAYVLFDLHRRNLGIRTLVCQLEEILIQVLAKLKINASTRCGAPGVYIDDKKIASIGLRVKKGCTYHGISLNINMNLAPFNDINPCGFAKLKMAQIKDYVPNITFEEVASLFTETFLLKFEL